MFSETPEETWARTRLAGQARHREMERKRGRSRERTCRQAGRAGGCNLNANDLNGMSKGELTRSGSNAGTSRPPSASLHSQTYFTASSRPRLSRVNCWKLLAFQCKTAVATTGLRGPRGASIEIKQQSIRVKTDFKNQSFYFSPPPPKKNAFCSDLSHPRLEHNANYMRALKL